MRRTVESVDKRPTKVVPEVAVAVPAPEAVTVVVPVPVVVTCDVEVPDVDVSPVALTEAEPEFADAAPLLERLITPLVPQPTPSRSQAKRTHRELKGPLERPADLS